MRVNPMQLIQLIRSGNNPQQLVMSILQQNSNNNPILNNAVNLAQKGDTSGLTILARNLAAQKGLDFDKEFGNFKQQLGI